MQISWSLRLRFLVCLIHPLPLLGYEHPISFVKTPLVNLGFEKSRKIVD